MVYQTLALPHFCRSFYVALSSDSTLLRFCTRLFYLNNPRKDPHQNDACLRDEQTISLHRNGLLRVFLQA